jgi:hypothetical protein
MDTKPLIFGKLDIGYFMENSSALCPGSATLDRFFMPFQTEMSEEPIDDIELEEAEPVDGSFLDVSLVEEVISVT